MNKIFMKRTFLFCLMIVVMIVLAAFKHQNNYDRTNKKIVLTQGKIVTTTVDLGKQGVLKNLINPHLYTIYGRLEIPGKPKLRCEGESSDMRMMLSQGSKKGIWEELAPQEILRSRANGVVPLNVEIAVPRENLSKHDVARGKLLFYEEDKLYATVLVKVINSKIKD